MLDPQQITDYQRDGAVALRGVFTDWVETLARGVERNMAAPGPYGTENVRPQDGGGSFFDDYCNWQRIPEFTDFMLHSPAAQVAGALMGAREVQVFHDHVLVKEPGTPKPTPWHQDMPYYCVDGMQTASFWIPLDQVTEENTLRLVLGSHRWPKLLQTNHRRPTSRVLHLLAACCLQVRPVTGRMIFTAHGTPSVRWSASQTAPIAPRPSSRTRRKRLPMTVP